MKTPRWTVYILRCGDGSLYTGITRDLVARLQRHQSGRGAVYTRSHPPVDVVYHESQPNRSKALIREAQIKSWPRQRKTRLFEPAIAQIAPDLPSQAQ